MKANAGLILITLILLVSLNGAAAGEIMIATDLHYIAPELTDNGEYFMSLLEQGDGKITMLCEPLVDDFLERVKEGKPDALILTGDLTFNGALGSHRALAEKLKDVEAAGIPVLVLPGNHDLNNRNAASFRGETFQRVTSAAAEDFREIYAELGFDLAVSADEGSLSYLAQLPDGSRILMLDTNTQENPCSLSEETLAWVDQALDEGALLAAGHQNLFQHSAMFSYGYVIGCSQRLEEIFSRHRVRLFLSGHMHLQHIMTRGDITDIAGSSLCVYPCQYGVLDTGSFSYHTERMDDYTETAGEFMDAKTRLQLKSFPQADVDFVCRANRAYFSGRLEEYPEGEVPEVGSFFTAYLRSIQVEAGRDYTV